VRERIRRAALAVRYLAVGGGTGMLAFAGIAALLGALATSLIWIGLLLLPPLVLALRRFRATRTAPSPTCW